MLKTNSDLAYFLSMVPKWKYLLRYLPFLYLPFHAAVTEIVNCSEHMQVFSVFLLLLFFLISAERSQQQSGKGNKTPINNDHPDNKKPTWISDIFQGIFTSETRCLNCETVTSKDEDFFDLSIDVEQNTSITSCLKNFSNTETLCSDNKFQCDSCCTLQEAHVSVFKFVCYFVPVMAFFDDFQLILHIFLIVSCPLG